MLYFKESDHNFDFNNNVESRISKCLFDAANNVCSSQCVDELKLKLANYDNFSWSHIEGCFLRPRVVDIYHGQRVCPLFH